MGPNLEPGEIQEIDALADTIKAPIKFPTLSADSGSNKSENQG